MRPSQTPHKAHGPLRPGGGLSPGERQRARRRPGSRARCTRCKRAGLGRSPGRTWCSASRQSKPAGKLARRSRVGGLLRVVCAAQTHESEPGKKQTRRKVVLPKRGNSPRLRMSGSDGDGGSEALRKWLGRGSRPRHPPSTQAPSAQSTTRLEYRPPHHQRWPRPSPPPALGKKMTLRAQR